MSTTLRITVETYEDMRADLSRPHSFAAERVGFLKARLGTGEGRDRLVLAVGYWPVADEDYIDDPKSGARINSTAIRKAMSIALQEDVGIFHVHLHDFPGIPGLGRMDQREIPHLIKTFRSTAPAFPHGIFLLSSDAFASWVWLPGEQDPVRPDRSVVVGAPLAIQRVQND